ncbi:NAD(P)/FAD-dependent oxidoreductase [Alteriqipengyuania sp. 357]
MKIAIIGAGMAGLTCGLRLRDSGHEVSLFDKGRGAGGRMATRRIEHDGQTFHFDHGAQYFTARDPDFVQQVEDWSRNGVVDRWSAAGQDVWVGTPGMNAPIRAMADALGVRFVRRVYAVARVDSRWRLAGEDLPSGLFDAVVVATPAEQAAPLLEPHSREMGDSAHWVGSAPCWSAMVVFAGRVDAPDTLSDVLPDGGTIGWAARNSAKPGRDAAQECWTIHASPDWSRTHLEERPADVCAELVDAFVQQVGALPPVIVRDAHRWRYAMVEKNDEDALWDTTLRLGACGDWLSGPRVENAFLSGAQLAALIGA